MLVEGVVYDALLSLAFIVAAWRLLSGDAGVGEAVRPSATKAAVVGGGIGLASGVIGLGGGIFLLPALMLGRWAKAKEAAGDDCPLRLAKLARWTSRSGGRWKA
ncbi:MAG: hypothetical protein Ct9H90mP1_0810 [Methanobacteriota archaeon]|nr:MAG: hypothetical protein Ct9H90mP1_0810 [Euryarchaeota archaeon]